jgi:death on curing protein
VANRRKEPLWLTRLVVDAIHTDQLREHGGLPGLRDENALESALARPKHRWYDERDVDLETFAAAYAFGLVMNHPYRDGNKRIGFLALVTFLGLNGLAFDAPEPDVVTTILQLAAGRTSEVQIAEWIRSHTIRPK